jgi:glycosyltransferase involved in cell wall biosynthesis
VHVITRMILGGAQENTLLTCQGLIARGHDVLLLTGPTRGPEGELLGEAARRGVPVEEVPSLVRPISPLRDLAARGDLFERFRRLGPRVVHTHSSKAGVLGRLAARAAGVPAVVHTIHGLPFHPYQGALRNWLYALAERYAAGRCDRIISVAEAMTRQAVAAGVAPPAKFTTVYSGMEVEGYVAARARREETRRRLGYADDDFVVAKLGRLFELKGHDFLLDAAARVVPAEPRARFLLIGDGVLREKLARRAERLGISGRVRFAGLVPAGEVPDFLAASDLVVHASLREGLPRAIPQALLCGTPVVAFDLDGTPEIVHDGQTGLLVPPRDVQGLAAAIGRMIREPELAARTAHAGRELAMRVFPAEIMVDRVAAVYEEVLAGRK